MDINIVISIVEFAEAACLILCGLALFLELIFAMLELFGLVSDRMDRIAKSALIVIMFTFIAGCILEGVSSVLSICFVC